MIVSISVGRGVPTAAVRPTRSIHRLRSPCSDAEQFRMARLGNNNSDVQRIFTADGCAHGQCTRTHASALARVQARMRTPARACPLARVYRRSVSSSETDGLCFMPYYGSPPTANDTAAYS